VLEPFEHEPRDESTKGLPYKLLWKTGV